MVGFRRVRGLRSSGFRDSRFWAGLRIWVSVLLEIHCLFCTQQGQHGFGRHGIGFAAQRFGNVLKLSYICRTFIGGSFPK